MGLARIFIKGQRHHTDKSIIPTAFIQHISDSIGHVRVHKMSEDNVHIG